MRGTEHNIFLDETQEKGRCCYIMKKTLHILHVLALIHLNKMFYWASRLVQFQSASQFFRTGSKAYLAHGTLHARS